MFSILSPPHCHPLPPLFFSVADVPLLNLAVEGMAFAGLVSLNSG